MQGLGTAVGALAAIGALIAATFAAQRIQIVQQAKELTALADERRREAAERRREQVSQVFVWWEIDDGVTCRITNASPYPT